MSAQLLANLLAALRIEEGWRDHAYLDTENCVTIGYGYNLGKIIVGQAVDVELIPANSISQAIGDTLLTGKTLEVIEQLNRELPWLKDLDEVRQEVLLDMAYNMGVVNKTGHGKKGLIDGWPNFLEQVRTGDYDGAADNMSQQKWARQVKKRATRLTEMMRTGVRTDAV